MSVRVNIVAAHQGVRRHRVQDLILNGSENKGLARFFIVKMRKIENAELRPRRER